MFGELKASMHPSSLSFIFDVILPVLILLVLGYALYKRKLINDAFVDTGSKLVFNVALPTLLFVSISRADFATAANPTLLAIGVVGTCIFFLLLLGYVTVISIPENAKGVVVQGGFRANMGIIGLAFCAQTYPGEGLAMASVYLGCVTILFNVLSVGVLTHFHGAHRSLWAAGRGILTNPLIISIMLALLVSYFSPALPDIVYATGDYLAQLTLPLALLCTGASLRFSRLHKDRKSLIIATVSKCLLYPFLLVFLGFWWMLEKDALGVLLLMAISPTAAASYVMVRHIGGDHHLAASIIAMTTTLSLPITAIAYMVMRHFQWVL